MVLDVRCGLVFAFRAPIVSWPETGFNPHAYSYSGFSFCGIGVCPEHRTTLAVVHRLEQVLTLVPASILFCFFYCDLPSWLLRSPVIQLVRDVVVANFDSAYSGILVFFCSPHTMVYFLEGFSPFTLVTRLVLLVTGRWCQPGYAGSPVSVNTVNLVLGRPESSNIFVCLFEW